MTKRMLIDASHAEETRVVVLDGNRLEDFDVETSTKKQLKGNIYLAKVVRVEPSLQAAFVEYGGGRHGFLAFGEIHPDYYQIPVADRQRLLALQAEEAQAEEEEDDDDAGAHAPTRPAEAARQEPHADAPHAPPSAVPPAPAEPAERAEHAESTDGDEHPAAVMAADAAPETIVAEPDAAEAHHPAVDEPTHVDHAHADDATTGSEHATSDSEPTAAHPSDDHKPTEHSPAAPTSHEAVAAEHVDSERAEIDTVGKSAEVAADSAPASEPLPPVPPSDGPDDTQPGGASHRPAQAASIGDETRYGEERFAPEPASGVDIRPSELIDPGSAEQPDIGGDHDFATAPTIERDAGAPGFDPDPTGDPDLNGGEGEPEPPPPELIGGENDTFEGNGAEEARARRASRLLRNYRIQEVIKRRQIMLIQVVKEERGNKGAALTTYISLAGRYCVLMPNSPRGGGISRKITSGADRRRLKEITAELEIPKGMGLIVRTAGAARPKPEIKRDCEYLMRLWDDIREHTMRSVAPALIYEEASLIKRAIRDVYSRDVDEVIVDGHQGWKAAHDFMRMLMPSHARKVVPWTAQSASGQPLFSKFGVEAQLDAMLTPTVQLKSGGYLVINQTEALVAIDVNSGRATRERGIEETAVKTNLEAADEVARQLRLRDLAGLIVIDFIDMESRKNNAAVERRLKEALKNDRARIQIGQISHFGLMEMSRQRLRPSLTETSFVICPHCGGAGHVRGIESSAVHVLRGIEEEGAKGKAALIMVHCANALAMHLLNNKRERLGEIEARYAMKVHFTADDSLPPPQMRIDRLKPQVPEHERPALQAPVLPAAPVYDVEDEADDVVFDEETGEEVEPVARALPAPATAEPRAGGEVSGDEEGERKRRRRRRRRGGRKDGAPGAEAGTEANGAEIGAEASGDDEGDADADDDDDALPGETTHHAEGFDRSEDDDRPELTAEASGLDAPAREPSGEDQPPIDASDLDENGLPKPRRRGRRGGRRRRRDASPEGGLDAADRPESGHEDGPDAQSEDPAETVSQPAPVPVPTYAAPVYRGPTPADPFGGGAYDIFDIIEQAEQQRATRHEEHALTEPTTPAEAAPVAFEPVAFEPVSDADIEHLAETPSEAVTVEVTVHVEPGVPAVQHVTAAPSGPVVSAEPEASPPSEQPVPITEAAEPAVVASVEPDSGPAHAAAQPEPHADDAAPVAEPESGPVIKPIVIGSDAPPTTERRRGWWRR